MSAIKMTPTEAIALVREKTQGQTFHEGSWGLLTAAVVLAGEVERLNEKIRAGLSFAAVHPRNPNAKCNCEHWQSCVECHPTAHTAAPVQCLCKEKCLHNAPFGGCIGLPSAIVSTPQKGGST